MGLVKKFSCATGVMLSMCLASTGAVASKAIVDKYDRNQFDSKKIKQGRWLFLKNCMVCHGFNAEGAYNWRERDEDGNFPPPPLNGTGHTSHHPMSALQDTIRNGTIRLGGKMPPWKDKLTNKEIELIIMWFQSQWPERVYQSWLARELESRAK